MRSLVRYFAPLVVVVVALVGFAGCGGDDRVDGADGDDRRSAATTSEAPEGTAPSATAAPPTTTVPPWPAAPDAVAVGDTPAHLAATLTRVETTLRELGAEAPPAAGWMQQQAYQAIAADPDGLDAVLDQVPEHLRAVVEANARAGISVGGISSPPLDLPAWEIRAPRPADELLGYYREAEAASSVPWPYLAAIHLVETRMGRIVGESWAGAQGPMQFIPSTWDAYGAGDVGDDRDAILAAGRYLAARGAPGDMDAALHAYNPTDRYVRAVRAYAESMVADPAVYHGYRHWQVYYRTEAGRFWLPEGYRSPADAVPVD